MSQASPLPAAVAQEIAAIADRFDQARQHDGSVVPTVPPLEAFLDQVAEEARPELLRRLLRLECAHRQQLGHPVTAAEARQRFAALGPWAADVVAALSLDEEPLTLTITGPQPGLAFQLAGHSACLVGRGPGVHLAIETDTRMSKQHFVVEYNPPAARARDLRSKNGTYLNGRRIDEADLSDGDELYAGQTTFRVRLPRVAPTVTGDAPDRAHTHPTSATTGPQPPLIPGYDVFEEVGRGGMGAVYKAREVSSGRLVAIKTVLPAVAPRPEVVGRFQREMAILQRLTHPNVVAFLETGESGALLYFVMEYVDGHSAATLVKRHGPFAPSRVVTLGCQLLGALAHAHLQGFVHRDVKPSNVLLTTVEGRESLKLADFGLARAYHASSLSGLTMTGTTGGTPGFMPPEQVLDFRSARPAADQYASAATLYFLLTGQLIYEPAASTADLMMRILNEEPLPLRQQAPALPRALAAVVCRALARDPRQRFPDVLAMREALAKCAE
jgi:serine/threonine-protein kinase